MYYITISSQSKQTIEKLEGLFTQLSRHMAEGAQSKIQVETQDSEPLQHEWFDGDGDARMSVLDTGIYKGCKVTLRNRQHKRLVEAIETMEALLLLRCHNQWYRCNHKDIDDRALLEEIANMKRQLRFLKPYENLSDEDKQNATSK